MGFPPLRIATRSSALALWQANFVAQQLAQNSRRPVELVRIQTQGDRDQAASLAVIGGLGVFTKEVQKAVLDGQADIAVHSLKDLPTDHVAGLRLAAVPARGPIGDVLISQKYRYFDELPNGARIATGSLRRRAMIAHRRPDIRLVDIRGNIDTRLRKLDDQALDAIILAEAGLIRLGMESRIAERLDRSWMIPAVGQGAIGIECRSDDESTQEALAPLDHPATHSCVAAERSLLRHLGGGCQVPIGAAGESIGGMLKLTAAVISPDFADRKDGMEIGRDSEAVTVGQRLAMRLTG